MTKSKMKSLWIVQHVAVPFQLSLETFSQVCRVSYSYRTRLSVNLGLTGAIFSPPIDDRPGGEKKVRKKFEEVPASLTIITKDYYHQPLPITIITKNYYHRPLPITMSIEVVLRSLSSMVALSGVAVIAMGLGVIDVDEGMWQCATAVIGPDLVPAKPFLLVLGSSKVLGALGLWGYGLFGKQLGYAACAIPPMCAVYGHSQLGEMNEAGAAGLYLIFVSSLYFVEKSKKSSGKKD
jgi:hypothetical protein